MESAKNGLERIINSVANLKHLSDNAKQLQMTEKEVQNLEATKAMYGKLGRLWKMILILLMQFRLCLSL